MSACHGIRRGPHVMRLLGVVFGLAVIAPCAQAQASLHVQVSGEVAHPGTLGLPAQARLRDAVHVAEVKPDAYVLGAAWFQSKLLVPQQRLRAGVIFELSTLVRPSPLTDQYPALPAVAQAMLAWIKPLPATGRMLAVKLDPDLLEISKQDNFLVGDGDQVIYPPRPTTVRVVGAVLHSCVFPQQGLQDLRAYLAHCPRSSAADSDTVYVIQPNGDVLLRGVALWDRSVSMPLAPGAVLYVPIDNRVARTLKDGDLNRDVADFLATQLVDSWSVAP